MGPGWLLTSLEKDLAAAGRRGVKVIRVEYVGNPDDDLPEEECFLLIQDWWIPEDA